jgi:hypothetical protein
MQPEVAHIRFNYLNYLKNKCLPSSKSIIGVVKLVFPL